MFEVEVVDTEQGFLALEDDWRSLVCQSPDVPYFLTWEFVSTRWKYFATNRELWVLTARDDKGDLVGIVPLAIAHRSLGPLRLRRLEFLSRAEFAGNFYPFDGENVDIIALPAVRDAVTEAFLEHLDGSKHQWDVADLGWLSADSRLRSHLRETSDRCLERSSECFVTTLPGDWSTYENDVLGKSEAKRIRRHARRLERDYPGRVDYHLVTERDEVGPAIDHLTQLNRLRWDGAGQSTVFEDDRFASFHREFAELAFDRGWLRLYQLRVDDQVVAANCGIVVRGISYLFQKGFDVEWRKYGPGVVFQAYEIERAIDEGLSEYDWAHGAMDAKIIWIDKRREDFQVIASSGWKGNLYLRKDEAWSKAKSFARSLVPQSTYLRLREAALRARRSLLRG